MEESKEKSKGAIIVEKEQFRVAEEFEGAKDLNFRPIAYTIFFMTVMFIVFITVLIANHP
ncbi:MAG TPA: hypothetical protein VFH43_12370 [Candidatus Kapabacteria bacterium]|jgi:hypothetical protein|nr:hypothetical protein [Candidatus Kapabacteria bacterium]